MNRGDHASSPCRESAPLVMDLGEIAISPCDGGSSPLEFRPPPGGPGLPLLPLCGSQSGGAGMGHQGDLRRLEGLLIGGFELRVFRASGLLFPVKRG